MENNEIILSICIASYNNGLELYEKALKILANKTNKIELVISDNSSTDNTFELLQTIKDSRFHLVSNEVNLGPTANYMKALAHGSGKYVMFATDKDSLNLHKIDEILKILEKNDFSMGYFALNIEDSKKNKIYKNQRSCLKKFAYLSKHPTGYFYNNSYLKELDIEKNFSDLEKVGYFPFEFLCAEIARHGNCAIINIAFCITAKILVGVEKNSNTYSSKNNNLFFTPQARFVQYERYINHLYKLPIIFWVKICIIYNLTKRTCLLITKAYYNTIKNNEICLYYKISKTDQNIVNIEQKTLEMLNESKIVKSKLHRLLFKILLKKGKK